MKLFKKMKDGGDESTVTGYFLFEIKPVMTIVLLRFDGESRNAYHTHAFNCLSWVLRGELREEMRDGRVYKLYRRFLPFITTRKDFHKVSSTPPTSWVFSIRGPWSDDWQEYLPDENRNRGLTHGRQEI